MRRKWIGLIGLTCGMAMLFLDSTVLPVAAPTIQKNLNVSANGINWIINSYFLATATLVLAFGRLADRFGYRRMFCLGMLIFAVASLLGGFANSGAWLIASRAFQGVGGAMMGPASWSIVIGNFPPRGRGRAMGFIIGVGSIFLSTGPSIGGFLTEFLSWRWIFWINSPIAILGIVFVLTAVARSDRHDEDFDIPGFLTYGLGLAALILALMQGNIWGWYAPTTLVLFFLSIVFFFLLFVTDKVAKHPFIDFKLYKQKVYLGGSSLILIIQFLLMISIFWPIFLQKSLGYSPLEAGAITLFSTVPVIGIAPLSGWILDRFDPYVPIMTGYILSTICFAWLLIFIPTENLAFLIPGLILFGASIAFVMTPNSTATMATLPMSKRGLGSGMFYTARFVGGTLGIALFGALILNVQHLYFTHATAINPATATLSSESLWQLMTQAESLTGLPAGAIRNAYNHGYAFAFSMAHLFGLVIALIGTVITYRTYRHYSQDH